MKPLNRALFLAAIVVVVLAGIGAFVLSPTGNRISSSVAQSGSQITMANYLKLKDGMSYEQAVAILGGPGVEQSRSSLAGTVTVLYAWEGPGVGANMNAMFQNNMLTTKAQFGLR